MQPRLIRSEPRWIWSLRDAAEKPRKRAMPGGTVVGYDRRLVDPADRARCLQRSPALRGFSEEPRIGHEHPERPPAQDGRGWDHGDPSGRRWRLPPRISSDRKGAAAEACAGCPAAMGRGQPLRRRRNDAGDGGNRHGPADRPPALDRAGRAAIGILRRYRCGWNGGTALLKCLAPISAHPPQVWPAPGCRDTPEIIAPAPPRARVGYDWRSAARPWR